MQQLQVASNSGAARSAEGRERGVDPGPDLCARELLDVAPPVVRAIRKIMRGYRLADLSVPQFRAMALLSYSPKASLSCVADFIGSSLPAASRMIDGLVSRKLVARKICKKDRRQVSLVLTPKGLSAFRESREATHKQLAEKLVPLSSDQRRSVIDAMRWLGELFGSDAERMRERADAETLAEADCAEEPSSVMSGSPTESAPSLQQTKMARRQSPATGIRSGNKVQVAKSVL
jgi:DNA-binding MarR family transcriptional regulator